MPVNWWPFGKETATTTLDVAHALLADIEKRGKQYRDDLDSGKFITPACKRTASDAGSDQAAIADHTQLEAFRYLLEVPRNEYRLLAEPDSQSEIIDGYLRQIPHDQMVVEFTGVTNADLAIAILAGFNWLVHCAVLTGGGDHSSFYGALRNFRRVASTSQKWWAADGAKERYAGMLQAGDATPLFLNVVWAEYGRLANEIAAAHAARR
jgi:hypothetical protein